MRRVVAGLFVSLDGVMESPDKWHFPYWSDEMGEVIDGRMATSDALLLGRVTYAEFAAYWPTADPADAMSVYMNDTPKYVVSRTLGSADWKNTTLLSGDLVAEITRLKQQPGKDISVVGSAALVQSLLQHDLLDELDLLIHPIVVGSGKRLFGDGADQKPLQLVSSKTFPTGVLSVTYRPAPAPAG